MGTIDKRAERGRWRARYRGPDGHEHSQTFGLKVEAQRWLKDQETSMAQSRWVNPSLGRTTVEQWLERYLPTRASDLRPSSYERFESICRRHILPTFGHRTLESIRTDEVGQWAADLQDEEKAPSGRALLSRSARKAVQTFNAVMQGAVDSNFIGRNPVAAVKRPEDDGVERDWMSAEQAVAVEAHLPVEFRVIVDLGFRCGLRWGELTSLRRRAVDVRASTITVDTGSARMASGVVKTGSTKTKKGRRTVPVARSVMARVAAHLEEFVAPSPDALVVSNRDGGPLSRQNFGRRVWRPTLEAAGLPETLTVHSMRHGYATALIAGGRDPKEVQEWCGHESVATTLRVYAHSRKPDDSVADELDAVFALPPVVGSMARPGLPTGRGEGGGGR